MNFESRNINKYIYINTEWSRRFISKRQNLFLTFKNQLMQLNMLTEKKLDGSINECKKTCLTKVHDKNFHNIGN